ncbi:MAG: hypothetical protein ACFFCQ_04190 [Promethearchaeota archaeon]
MGFQGIIETSYLPPLYLSLLLVLHPCLPVEANEVTFHISITYLNPSTPWLISNQESRMKISLTMSNWNPLPYNLWVLHYSEYIPPIDFSYTFDPDAPDYNESFSMSPLITAIEWIIPKEFRSGVTIQSYRFQFFIKNHTGSSLPHGSYKFTPKDNLAIVYGEDNQTHNPNGVIKHYSAHIIVNNTGVVITYSPRPDNWGEIREISSRNGLLNDITSSWITYLFTGVILLSLGVFIAWNYKQLKKTQEF